MKNKQLSVIVPCYNEEQNLNKFFEVFESTFINSSIVIDYQFIDDGSSDDTLQELKKIINKPTKNKVSVISFSRNFGKEAGILAGLNQSESDYYCIIDADLQQNPKYVLQMLNLLENDENIDVVACYQNKRKENKMHTFFKKVFYKLINKISEVEFYENASDFRTFRKKVRDAILDLNENNRFSKGLFSWVGFETFYMPYEVLERQAGDSTWSFFKLFNYALDGFFGYSTTPLRFATFWGTIVCMLSIIYFIAILTKRLILTISISRYALIIFLILFLSGIHLLSIGIIGEYLARAYMELKNRPHYIIDKIYSNDRD